VIGCVCQTGVETAKPWWVKERGDRERLKEKTLCKDSLLKHLKDWMYWRGGNYKRQDTLEREAKGKGTL
jgi:hypothetical protein